MPLKILILFGSVARLSKSTHRRWVGFWKDSLVTMVTKHSKQGLLKSLLCSLSCQWGFRNKRERVCRCLAGVESTSVIRCTLLSAWVDNCFPLLPQSPIRALTPDGVIGDKCSTHTSNTIAYGKPYPHRHPLALWKGHANYPHSEHDLWCNRQSSILATRS